MRAGSGLAIVLAVLLPWSSALALPEDPKECAQRYISEHVRFESTNERDLALSQAGLREPPWADLQSIFPGDRFFYFSTSFSSQTFGLVVVDSDCTVMSLGDKDQVEAFLGLREPRMSGVQEATSLALAILRLCHVSDVFGKAYSDGVNIITTLDAITFKSEAERRRIGIQVEVTPPKIELHEDGFTYRFFTWNRLGNGDIYENVLHLDAARHISHSEVVVHANVGDWQGLR